MTLVEWTKEAAEEVTAVVKDYKSRHIGTPQRIGVVMGDGSLVAKITGNAGAKYSWVAVEPNPAGGWTNRADWGSGTTTTNYAREFQGSSTNLTGKFVRLSPAGNKGFYVFSMPTTTDDDGGSTSSQNCCTAYASNKAEATVTACASTNLLDTYHFTAPNLENLKPPPDALFAVPTTSITLEWISSCHFESDTVHYKNLTTNLSDDYHWELDVDSSSRDVQTASLILVHDGGTNNPQIIGLEYKNVKQYWDSLGGTLFSLVTDRNDLPSDVGKWFPCDICIVPPVRTSITDPCLTAAAAYFNRDLSILPWPQKLYFDVVDYGWNPPNAGPSVWADWVSKYYTSGTLDWLVGDPKNNGNPDYPSWGKRPIDPNNVMSTPTLPSVFDIGGLSFGGSTTTTVRAYPCVSCFGSGYNPYYFQFYDGLPIGYNVALTGGGGYYTFHYLDCSRGMGGSNYGGGSTMPSMIDPTTKMIDFYVVYSLFMSDPGNPLHSGCTPRTLSGQPAAWTFTLHIYE